MSRKSGLFSIFKRILQFFSPRIMGDDDNLDEFPVGLNPREVNDFERTLTSIYRTSSYARERRLKNVVQSITCYNELRHGYLVVKVKNHNNNGFTSLRLERTRNKDLDFTNSSTSLLPASLLQPSSPEGVNTIDQPHALTPRNPSIDSVQQFKPYVAMDVIGVFDDHGNLEDVSSQEIRFVNQDFTLHDLSMIAKVVHDVRAEYPVEGTKYYWFAAVVARVAMNLYPTNRDVSFDAFWGPNVNVNDSVNDAIELFRKLEDTNKRLIEEAANPAEMARRDAQTGEEAREKAKQAEQEAEQGEQEARRAWEQAEQATREAEQAKREVQEKDAEIARLKGLLAQTIGQGTVERGG